MNRVFTVIMVLLAGLIASFLNAALGSSIPKREQRFGLYGVTYLVFFALSLTFIAINAVKARLNNFMDEKIIYIEGELRVLFPHTAVGEANLDAAELTGVLEALDGVMSSDPHEEDYVKIMVLRAFMDTIRSYTVGAEDQSAKLGEIADEKGMITIKSLLRHSKEQSLAGAAPYFALAQTVTIIALLVYIIMYSCAALFLKRGGGAYKQSIIFGEVPADLEKGLDDRGI